MSVALHKAIPMKSLQLGDRLLGIATLTLLQPFRLLQLLSRPREPVRKVLLVKFWGMGSLQLLTPAVRVLRTRYPDAELTLLTLDQNRAFAQGLGIYDRVLDLKVSDAGWFGLASRILRLFWGLRRERFDVVYDLEFFTKFSAVVTAISGSPVSYGFSSPQVWRGRFHSHTVPFNRYWHVARNFRSLVGGENGEDVSADHLSAFQVQPEHQEEVDRVLPEAIARSGRPLIALNPNAGALSLERRWPRSYFAELSRRLIRERDACLVLIGTRDELQWTADLQAMVGTVPEDRLINLAGKLSMGGLHALLTRVSGFVTNDSGPMHVAAALGVPTVGLFGPETPVIYRPLGRRARALYNPPPCSPCINVHNNKFAVCHRGRPDCLIGITVDEVFEELDALLRGEHVRILDVPRQEWQEASQ